MFCVCVFVCVCVCVCVRERERKRDNAVTLCSVLRVKVVHESDFVLVIKKHLTRSN